MKITIKRQEQEETALPKNFFTRLKGVYFSPRKAFCEIGRAPKVLIPLIVVLFLSIATTWYKSHVVDMRASMAAQLEPLIAKGQITEEQINMQLAMSERFMPFSIVFSGSLVLVVCIAIAAYGKLISSFVGAENQFRALLAVSAYTLIAVPIVFLAIFVIIAQIKGFQGTTIFTDSVATNLGAWIESFFGRDALPGFLMLSAKMVDVFVIWELALLSIGFSAVSKKLSASMSAVWLGGIYTIFALISVAGQMVLSN